MRTRALMRREYKFSRGIKILSWYSCSSSIISKYLELIVGMCTLSSTEHLYDVAFIDTSHAGFRLAPRFRIHSSLLYY